jgi:signal transduction histidine kinase
VERLALPGDFSESKVRALARSADGRIWVGTEGGLFCSEGDGRTHFTPREGLPRRDVRALLADRDGDLWIGTYGGGLARLAAGRWESFREAQGLASDVVWALHEGGDGTLWIGTQRGLSWRKDDRFHSITAANGLLELAVNSVVEDHDGNLWLGGEKGIYRMRRDKLESFAAGRLHRVAPAAFGTVDGLRNDETNGQKSQPAAWCDRKGTVWIPTVAGLVKVAPNELRAVEVAPVVVIESIIAGDATVFRDGKVFPANFTATTGPEFQATDSPVVSEIRLAAGQRRSLEIHYTAPSFVSPELVRFRYRLDGEDSGWNEVGSRRAAYYTHLQPGRYGFRVQACNSHGVWSERDATLALRVEPMLTEIVGVRVTAAIVALALVVTAFHWRFRNRLRLERLERENALAAERSRIAKDLHDVVGANLTAIATHLELARQTATPAAPCAPIDRARAVVAETARTMSEIIWSTDPRQDTLEATANYLCRYADDFLEPAGIRCRFELPPLLPPLTLAAQLRHQLLLTAREALTNVVKHAHATEVRLRFAFESGRLKLEISDNGRGLPATPSPGEGNGLSNMRRRIESVGGQVAIERPTGGGWEVKIELPLADSARRPGASA